jgi:predicted dehydrogenase
MLKVGLIGLGGEWEKRYRPALLKLRPRLRVQAVYAPVSTQAEQGAAELGCHVASGLLDLLEREDVQAILVLDAAWYGEVPAQFACLAGKSAFLSMGFFERGPFEHTFPVDRLARLAADKGVTLMPDFAHRYTPATSRLRELVATRLGKIVCLDVALSPAGPTSEPPRSNAEVLTMAVDWCVSLVGSSPRAVRAVPDSGTPANDQALDIDFRVPTAGTEAVTARIRTDRTAIVRTTADPSRPAGGNPASAMFRAQAQCQRGTAILEGPYQVTWESDGERKCESLIGDPADVEVMLDHFCRRVVGGLIPVPTLDDFCRAAKWVDQAIHDISHTGHHR